MRRYSGSNIRAKYFLGLLAAFALFLLYRRKNPGELEIVEILTPGSNSAAAVNKSDRVKPINQNLGPIRRASLLPYIEAQARFETGNYSSPLARNQFNLFGMKKPSDRKFVGQKLPGSDYMTYKSYSESVQDLLLWMDAKGFPASVKDSFDYVSNLKSRGYFTDNMGTYLAGVNKYLEDLRKEGKTGFKIQGL